jgi:Raf kinase inhibitor-like YbhB/YbcL family protein
MLSHRFITIVLVLACSFSAEATAQERNAGSLTVSSSSFPSGGEIPKRFTCDGDDASPQLAWTGAPAGTQSFLLIADDPDAPGGTWTHWVLYDLPATTSALSEAMPKAEQLPDGSRQGRNDFRKIGYNGPCPPPGKPHRYYFRIYALDRKISVKAGAARNEVEKAIAGHVQAQGEFIGTYRRSGS